jgi:hypothetical protein
VALYNYNLHQFLHTTANGEILNSIAHLSQSNKNFLVVDLCTSLGFKTFLLDQHAAFSFDANDLCKQI